MFDGDSGNILDIKGVSFHLFHYPSNQPTNTISVITPCTNVDALELAILPRYRPFNSPVHASENFVLCESRQFAFLSSALTHHHPKAGPRNTGKHTVRTALSPSVIF